MRIRYIDTNTIRHFAIIAYVLVLAYQYGSVYLLLYPAILAVVDVLYYRFGIAVFDTDEVIERGYEISTVLNDDMHSTGLDYGFNYYAGDYTKSRAQAQIDEFEYAIEQLGLEPGMRLMDVGCGCGDWLSYLAGKGIEVTGINLTKAQVSECEKRGLDVIHANWKDLAVRLDDDPAIREKLLGQFDCVTFWDTVEHYVPARHRHDKAKQNEVYSAMFRFASRLLDPRSPAQRVFVSCLHRRREHGDLGRDDARFRRLAYLYIMDKFHSGFYPSARDDQLVANAEPYFDLANRADTTLDYYMTSKLEPTHFGRHRGVRWTPKRAAYTSSLVAMDPNWIQRLIWYRWEGWMHQFDADNIDESDMIHFWLTFERKTARVEAA